MKFIWMGAEAPNDVDLLYGAGVRDMGLSLSSFRRRVKSPQNNLDRFPDDVRLYLYDSAAWATDATQDDLIAGAEGYEKFLHQWYGKFFAFTEFDAPTLGKEYILERREDFYDEDRFAEKFWVSWNPSYGLDHLKYLGESYTDVVVPVSSLQDRQTLNVIGILKREYQTSFHCHGFSLDRDVRHELFDTIFMSTWSSALRHSDIYVPTGGNWVVRAPKNEQAAQLKRHAKFVEDMGCDLQMLIDGNAAERELYTIRLFRWLESGYSSILDVLSESSDESAPTRSSAPTPLVSDSEGLDQVQNVIPLLPERYPITSNDTYPITGTSLPGIQTEVVRSFQPDEEGRMVISDQPLLRRSAVPVRSCNTCSLSSNCPAFQPGAQCKFHVPVQIRTREQMAALTEAILEMQASRVMFAQFAEETSGYHDPVVGKEMDRFAKLAAVFAKLGESKETVRIEASRTTQGGVLSQIFGQKVQSASDE